MRKLKGKLETWSAIVCNKIRIHVLVNGPMKMAAFHAFVGLIRADCCRFPLGLNKDTSEQAE